MVPEFSSPVLPFPPQIAMLGASSEVIHMALLSRWSVVLARVYGGWLHHLTVKLLVQGGRFAMKASRGFAAHGQHVVATGKLAGSPYCRHSRVGLLSSTCSIRRRGYVRACERPRSALR